MDALNLPYKTTFAAQIRAIQPTETDVKEAKASIADLKNLLPPGVDPEADPQLLYIAANLYVAGMVNLNDDGVDLETSLAAYRGFEKQQLNIEHDRKRIAGYILHAGLSEFGTDRLITADEARQAGKPFNVCVVAALWKVANRELCAYLEEAANPLHPEYKQLSLSFEVGYSSFNIGVINSVSRVIAEATKIVRPEDPDFASMSARLRANGGSGKMGPESADGVYQILTGSFLPLGGGIVAMPAAAVKGITVVMEPVETEKDVDGDDDGNGCDTLVPECDVEMVNRAAATKSLMTEMQSRMIKILSLLNKSSYASIISPQTRVSSITSQTITYSMKSLKDIKESLAAVQKPEDYKEIAASILEIAEAITKASDELQTKLAEEQNRSAEIEKNRAEAAAVNEELKKNFDAVKAEIDQLKAVQAQAAAETKFNERMATIDEVFALTDEDRAALVDEVKDLDEEAFAKKMDKLKKLMKEKTKAHIAAVAAESQKKNSEIIAALKEKGVTVTLDENNLIKEVIASAQSNNVSTSIRNTIDGSPSLKDLVAQEFADNVSIGGKKISQFKQKE